jgi:hypothetical protein
VVEEVYPHNDAPTREITYKGEGNGYAEEITRIEIETLKQLLQC